MNIPALMGWEKGVVLEVTFLEATQVPP